jgi:hypothetical protein
LKPTNYFQVPRKDAIATLKDRAFRDRIKADTEFAEYVNEHGGWEGIVGTVFNRPDNKQYEGKSILEISFFTLPSSLLEAGR